MRARRWIERQCRTAIAGLWARANHFAAADHRMQADVQADMERTRRAKASIADFNLSATPHIGSSFPCTLRPAAILHLDLYDAFPATSATVHHATQQHQANSAHRTASYRRLRRTDRFNLHHFNPAQGQRWFQMCRKTTGGDHAVKAGIAMPVADDSFHDISQIAAPCRAGPFPSTIPAGMRFSAFFHGFPSFPPDTGVLHLMPQGIPMSRAFVSSCARKNKRRPFPVEQTQKEVCDKTTQHFAASLLIHGSARSHRSPVIFEKNLLKTRYRSLQTSLFSSAFSSNPLFSSRMTIVEELFF